MAAKLSLADYDLLNELNRRGGTTQSTGLRQRDDADRLVAAGYATSRNLNVSTVEYEITQSGRIALVLKAYGILDTRISTIEPHRFEVDGRWWVKVSSDGDPALLMDIGSTTKLTIQLRAIGADDLANRFEAETDRARRYALGRTVDGVVKDRAPRDAVDGELNGRWPGGV